MLELIMFYSGICIIFYTVWTLSDGKENEFGDIPSEIEMGFIGKMT